MKLWGLYIECTHGGSCSHLVQLFEAERDADEAKVTKMRDPECDSAYVKPIHTTPALKRASGAAD